MVELLGNLGLEEDVGESRSFARVPCCVVCCESSNLGLEEVDDEERPATDPFSFPSL